jgi:SAM-dependent methyltransferase/biotin operon repressor
MNQLAPPVLGHLQTLADPLRVRLLLVLEGQTLSVGELCEVLQLPQSTISRHLKTLTDAGWTTSHREGTSRLYAMPEDLPPASAELWVVVRQQLAGSAAADQDRARLAGVLAARRAGSAAFFSRAAGDWDGLRDDLFGPTFHLEALLALMDPSWTVADLGCGTGRLATAVAPFVRRVLAVDASPEMLAAARVRLEAQQNVDVLEGTLEAVPVPDRSVDVALVVLVLHHVGEPAQVLAEARRILVPGGRVVVVDMLPHDRDEYRAQMGHVWLGFSAREITRLLTAAGFDPPRVVPLPPALGVRGPSLFVAAATAAAS